MADTYNTVNMLPKKMMIEDCKGSRDVDIITQQFTKARLYLVGEIDWRMAMDFIAAMSVLADEQRDV